MDTHALHDVVVVADAGMVSEANMDAIEAARLPHILGAKMPRVPYVIDRWRKEHELGPARTRDRARPHPQAQGPPPVIPLRHTRCMDQLSTVTAALMWIPVALTAIGTILSGIGARATKQQVDLQRTLAQDAAQPYVWADVQASDYEGFLLDVVVGNSGDTVATDVKVRFDPPLPVDRDVEERDAMTRTALQRLENGLRSLAPTKTLRWSLGAAGKLLEATGSQAHTVTIDAQGPFGPLPTLEYVIDLSDFRESADRPAGSLHLLTKAVEKGLGGLR